MASLRDKFFDQGFIVLESAMSPSLREGLRQASDILHRKIESGELAGNRIQTVLRPDVYHPAYLEFLNLEPMNQAAQEIMDREDLMFPGLACLYGSRQRMVCNWHRDFRDWHPETPDLLKIPTQFIQTNCAIYDDESLWVLPASHCRLSTDEEKAYAERFSGLPFISKWEDSAARDASVPSGMPGSILVKLSAGDCLMYNPMIWHAAEYRPEWKRATLHGGYKDPSLVPQFEAMRWGIRDNPWLEKPDYLGDLGPYFGRQVKHYQHFARVYAKEGK